MTEISELTPKFSGTELRVLLWHARGTYFIMQKKKEKYQMCAQVIELQNI